METAGRVMAMIVRLHSRPIHRINLSASMEDSELRKSYQSFASHGKSGVKNPAMDGKNWSKCCKDSKVVGGKITTTDVDIVFSKVKAKTARVISYGEFVAALKELAEKKYKGKEMSAEDQEKAIFKLVKEGSPQNVGVTKTSKTGGVAKMTDTSQYTGAHKERFDAGGKGKGIAGREELAENSGYVGNYKGSGTYDDKVSK